MQAIATAAKGSEGVQVSAALKFSQDIFKKLVVVILTAPLVWVGTAIYSNAISEMVTSFDVSWYRHYWYLVLITVGIGVLQFIYLCRAPNAYVAGSLSVIGWILLLSFYAWRQIEQRSFPFEWPLLVFFFLFCLIAAVGVAISTFIAFVIVRKLLADS